MDIRFIATLGFVTLISLSGCAGMNADECVTGDWHTIGFEDGSRGYAADRLGDHRRACAKHGVSPDFVAYRAGHKEGLRDFCQPSRAFRLGSSGGAYNGVCHAQQENVFLDAYRSGHHLYTLRSRVNSIDQKIGARENEIEATRERIREAEAALIGADTPTEERILLLSDIKKFAERSGELEAEIELLRQDRVRHEYELASYQQVLADTGY